MSVHIEVDPSALSLVAGNLRRSVAVAEDFTHQRGALANMVDDSGSGRLSGAVEHFVERWAHGMGLVADDATALAERLEAAGTGYAELEAAIAGAMR